MAVVLTGQKVLLGRIVHAGHLLPSASRADLGREVFEQRGVSSRGSGVTVPHYLLLRLYNKYIISLSMFSLSLSFSFSLHRHSVATFVMSGKDMQREHRGGT